MVPQVRPALKQVLVGVQPQTPGTPPPPQDSKPGHKSQLSMLPHPSSAMVPHVTPALAHEVVGWQTQELLALHTSFVPVQVPQSSVVPQPSSTEPQVAPRSAHVLGVHVHVWSA